MTNSDPDEGAAVDNDVVVNGEGVSSEIDENLFQDVLSAGEGDGSPEVVKTRSGRIVKSTRRQDSLYYRVV